jgi:U4/U6.U5 tri-snRNP-associated protein 2
MKRGRDDEEGDGAAAAAAAAAQPAALLPHEPAGGAGGALGSDDDASDSEDARGGGGGARGGAKAARECPYLDTVHRSTLDFDFEKCCSVTLSPLHCYACLVCGKYFQGRGPATVAYTHALEAGHHVFMNLADGRVYCLPDGYEVLDRSLDDIRHVLNPRVSRAALDALDASRAWSRALDGAEYLPGVIGLNNLKATDYVSVVVQALMRVKPLRDALLLRAAAPPGAPLHDSLVLLRFGELTRKIWNPRNFKGQVCTTRPHQQQRVGRMTPTRKRGRCSNPTYGVARYTLRAAAHLPGVRH